MALERRGSYEVVEASNGRECLKKVKKERPELILLDIMMPGMDGWEICKKIKEDASTKDIKVVLLSVRKSEDDIAKSLEYAHAEMQVEKSWGFDTIIETISGLLG